MADLSDQQRAELRERLRTVFEGADYPVSDGTDFLPALPDGPTTRIEVGEFSITVLELDTKVPKDYPYDGVDVFVEDLVQRLDEADVI